MKDKSTKEVNYLGHRDRMRKKLLINSDNIFDYELLEILLYFVFPRKDTKTIAKELLQHFGSMREVVFADDNSLLKVNGVGRSVTVLMYVIREVFNRIYLEKIKDTVVIASSDNVINYYKNLFWCLKQEQLRIMFLNNKNRLLADELLQVGTVDQTAIYPREIIHKALEYGASAMIMVHNHPSGDPHPSRQDIIMTKLIKDVAQKLDIMLLDHIIIGKNESKSLKELGII